MGVASMPAERPAISEETVNGTLNNIKSCDIPSVDEISNIGTKLIELIDYLGVVYETEEGAEKVKELKSLVDNMNSNGILKIGTQIKQLEDSKNSIHYSILNCEQRKE